MCSLESFACKFWRNSVSTSAPKWDRSSILFWNEECVVRSKASEVYWNTTSEGGRIALFECTQLVSENSKTYLSTDSPKFHCLYTTVFIKEKKKWREKNKIFASRLYLHTCQLVLANRVALRMVTLPVVSETRSYQYKTFWKHSVELSILRLFQMHNSQSVALAFGYEWTCTLRTSAFDFVWSWSPGARSYFFHLDGAYKRICRAMYMTLGERVLKTPLGHVAIILSKINVLCPL